MPISDRSRNGSPLRPAFIATSSYKPDSMQVADELHPVIHSGRVAVITGAASGIGRAAALEFAKLELKVALADIDEEKLKAVGKDVAAVVGEANVVVVPTNVAKLEEVVRLRDKVYELWGEVRIMNCQWSCSPPSIPSRTLDPVAVLMNNAGIGAKGTSWDGIENWRNIFDVNLFGIVNVQQTFVPSMLHQENQAMIINTGSKQGITNPPGNAAYNASKAAVKSLTEGLAHELRERPHSNVTAHLFIPGWTFTPLAGSLHFASKPEGAWTPEETVLYMIDKARYGDFYILCPDNETKRAVDELRIMWAAGDIAEGRPALSRWHRDYKALFEEYMRDGLASSDSGRA
ncbi:NAD(P)-binding protein [Armillaria solidipes]|uniref:NAD(P)-binding protein n=1 Tax=Armillaria solidipes TaxID=1076256 RepID=A0A2H3BMM1_9AGAR|nr:NAD(P)-binding protein [Armillaria solidipes]